MKKFFLRSRKTNAESDVQQPISITTIINSATYPNNSDFLLLHFQTLSALRPLRHHLRTRIPATKKASRPRVVRGFMVR